ncbi:hypothetical protein MMA231_02475 [Asticcacaulis sp. MM231]|uniref:head completion/stabilization protein n=1 Tax=Asticcacaulis sp. MM231 TaxID=3157666 RepID=UPI0032D58C40
MSGFVISPPEDASPAGATVSAGEFWPAIDLNAFRKAMRVGNATIPDPRLIPAITGAIITVSRDLKDWKALKIEAGCDTLSDVESEKYGDDTELELLWSRAVFAYATADLLETHPDITATKAGIDKEQEVQSAIAHHQRNGLNAIRDILGCRRVDSELI